MAPLKVWYPVVTLIACQPAIPPSTPMLVTNQTTVMEQAGPPGMSIDPSLGEPPVQTEQIRSILVVTDKRLPRPTEVIGVLDFHTSATSQDKGFDELRVRAAAMGADAVIGAEFEHGGASEPSHLSGIVVRFLDR